jgi:hypothetical protein
MVTKCLLTVENANLIRVIVFIPGDFPRGIN